MERVVRGQGGVSNDGLEALLVAFCWESTRDRNRLSHTPRHVSSHGAWLVVEVCKVSKSEGREAVDETTGILRQHTQCI